MTLLDLDYVLQAKSEDKESLGLPIECFHLHRRLLFCRSCFISLILLCFVLVSVHVVADLPFLLLLCELGQDLVEFIALSPHLTPGHHVVRDVKHDYLPLIFQVVGLEAQKLVLVLLERH